MPAPLASVEQCGDPELLVCGDLAQISISFHTTDPTSTVHADLHLYLHPRTGMFWFEPEWSW